MTLNSIFRKLRKVDRKQYRQFEGCLIFANALVSSFFAVLFSNFIQSILPEGGDSRKQIYLIFALAVIGCYIFVLYAAGLFLRQKSRQIGIFLALGTERIKLTKTMLTEISYITGCTAVIGIVLGNILALIIGKVFETIAVNAEERVFRLSITGIVAALCFGLVIFLCLFIMTYSAMKRSNIMDIINEQRKSEPIKKDVTHKYLISGIVMFGLGIFLAVILPRIYVAVFKQYLSGLFNAFYLFSVVGVYRILVYSIVSHKRGRNPQKYYRNLISNGLLKFQGISMVRNMGLIALLIMGALYAAFYLPSNITAGNSLMQNNPVDVSYRIPKSSETITKQEVEELAEEYGQQIKEYREIEFIELLSSGINRDNIDDSGKIIEEYEKESCYRQFVSVSEINEKMGMNLSMEEGTYKMLRSNTMAETLLFAYDDLDYVQNTATGAECILQFAGTEIFNELVVSNGWDTFARFIINDNDYARLSEGVEAEHQINQVLFNVSDLENSYQFAKELFREYCLRAEENMKVLLFFDSHLARKAEEGGQEYWESEHITLEPDHPEIELDWKFAPYFKILFQKNMILQYAVQYLLFAYVAIVMLASVGIIGYTRSQSIGLRNKQVFEDIRKLGGDNNFLTQNIKSQLKKVYFLPTATGVGIIYLYQLLIFYQNDGVFAGYELMAAVIDLILCFIVVLYQYVGYQISLKEVKKIVGINE